MKQELTKMQGDDPGSRKYLQNINYFVGSLEQTMQRDANGAVIYRPAPAAIYSARPPATAPTAQLQAYIEACQTADKLRDAQFPHDGGPALNHRPLDSELKTILLNIATRCIQESVSAVLQPEPQREDLNGSLQ
jgi:hypothetical protein